MSVYCLHSHSYFQSCLANMTAVARSSLRKLKLPSGSRDTMAAVARVNLRNLKLPPGSWDSHVHVIDEVGHAFDQAGSTLLTSELGSLPILQQPRVPPRQSHRASTARIRNEHGHRKLLSGLRLCLWKRQSIDRRCYATFWTTVPGSNHA